MKKRSLFKILLYFILTLGIYELIWLAQTRKELMALTDVKIPKTVYIVATRIFGIAISLLVIYLAFMWLGLGNNNQPGSISSGCWSQYTLAGAPEDVNSSQSISASCKQEIAQFYRSDAEQTNQYKLYGLIVILGMLFTWVYLQWFKYYATAVEKATNGRISGITTMLAVGLLPYGVTMLVLQHAFNSSKSIPLNQTTSSGFQQVTEFAPIRKSSASNIAKGIGIGVAILIALIFLFQIFISI